MSGVVLSVNWLLPVPFTARCWPELGFSVPDVWPLERVKLGVTKVTVFAFALATRTPMTPISDIKLFFIFR